MHCGGIAGSLGEETEFEEQKVWSSPDSYPWACHIYQVHSNALYCVALRQAKEKSNWKPMRVLDDPQPLLDSLKETGNAAHEQYERNDDGGRHGYNQNYSSRKDEEENKDGWETACKRPPRRQPHKICFLRVYQT